MARERATCNGLAESPWAWLAMDGLGFVIYVYFFFQILVQIFFGFFFFFWIKVEHINFFFLI